MKITRILKIENCSNGYIITVEPGIKKIVAKSKEEVCKLIAESIQDIIPEENNKEIYLDLTYRNEN